MTDWEFEVVIAPKEQKAHGKALERPPRKPLSAALKAQVVPMALGGCGESTPKSISASRVVYVRMHSAAAYAGAYAGTTLCQGSHRTSCSSFRRPVERATNFNAEQADLNEVLFHRQHAIPHVRSTPLLFNRILRVWSS